MLNPKNGKAFITEGNHRLAAARKAGVEYVPVRIVNSQDSPGNETQLRRVGKYVAPREKLDKIAENQDTILPRDVFFDSELLPEDSEGFAQAAGSERAGKFNETAAERKFVDATTEKDAKKDISRWTREENGLVTDILEKGGRFTATFSDKPKEKVDLGIDASEAFKEAERQIMLRTAEFDTVDYDGFAQKEGKFSKPRKPGFNKVQGDVFGDTPITLSSGNKINPGDWYPLDRSYESGTGLDDYEKHFEGVTGFTDYLGDDIGFGEEPRLERFPSRYTGVTLFDITGKEEDKDKFIFRTEEFKDNDYPVELDENGLSKEEYEMQEGDDIGWEAVEAERIAPEYAIVTKESLEKRLNADPKKPFEGAEIDDYVSYEDTREYTNSSKFLKLQAAREDLRQKLREQAAEEDKKLESSRKSVESSDGSRTVTLENKTLKRGDKTKFNVSIDSDTLPLGFQDLNRSVTSRYAEPGKEVLGSDEAEFTGITLDQVTGNPSDSNTGLYRISLNESIFDEDADEEDEENADTFDVIQAGYYFLSDNDFFKMKSGDFDWRQLKARKSTFTPPADLSKGLSSKDVITKDESSAARKYSTRAAYIPINKALRTGTPVPKDQESVVRGLDSLTSKNPLIASRLFRGEFFSDGKVVTLGESRRGLDDFEKAKKALVPGAEFIDPGFMSTSTDLNSIDLFVNPVQALTGNRLTGKSITYALSPKGSKLTGYSMGSALSRYAEDEVILPRNSKFKVTSVKEDSNGNLTVELDLVETPDNTKSDNVGFAQTPGKNTQILPAGVDEAGFAQLGGKQPKRPHRILEAIASLSNALGLFDEWKGKTSKVREDVNNVGEFVNNMRYVKADLQKAIDNLKKSKGVEEKMAAISELSAAIKKAKLAARIAKDRWKKNHPEDLKPKKPATPKAIEAPTVDKVAKDFTDNLDAADAALKDDKIRGGEDVDGFAQTLPSETVPAKTFEEKKAKAVADNKSAAAKMLDIFRERIKNPRPYRTGDYDKPYSEYPAEDPMSAPVNPSNMPFNPSSEHQYSGINHHALAAAAAERGYTDPRWMSVAQAKKMGAKIRDGEQGVRIMTFRTIENEDTGERVLVQTPVTVFNAAQMDGLEPYNPKQQQKMTASQALEFVLGRFAEAEKKRGGSGRLKVYEDLIGIETKEGPNKGKPITPFWSVSEGVESIRLPDRSKYDSPEDYLYSLFHELAHASGTRRRLGREGHLAGRGVTDPQRAREEAVAEIASQLLLQRLGINHDPNRTAEYLKSHRLSDAEITKAMAEAEIAVDFVLGNDVLPPWINSSVDMMEQAGVPGYPGPRSWNPDTNLRPEDAPSAYPPGTPGSDENPEITGFAQKPGGKSRTGKKVVSDSKTATEKVMAGLFEKIKQGETPWRKPYKEGEKYAGMGLPRNPSSKHIYSGVNAMALRFAQEENGYSDPRWMTYKQAEQMGGQVRKGEKGTFILVPMRIVQKDEKDPNKTRSFTMFKAMAVFNAEQIDGLNLPDLSTESLPKMTPLDAQEFIVERYKKAMAARTGKAPNVTHKYVGVGGAHQAPSWGTISDQVTLPNLEQFESPEDLFDTIAHELVHSTGHPNRLDRSDLTKDYETDLESRAREELIAEIGAALLGNMFGVDAVFDNSAAYVQSWLKHLKSNPDEIISATSQAQKAVDYILGTELGDWSPLDGYSIGNAVQKSTDESKDEE